MTLYTALRKIKKLTAAELRHCIFLAEEEIRYYKTCIVNYPSDRLERYGKPHLKRLKDRKKAFEDRLKEIGGDYNK